MIDTLNLSFVPRGKAKQVAKAKYLKIPSTGKVCKCGHKKEDFKDDYTVCYKGAPREDHPSKEEESNGKD